jgi:hypothetical protein
VVVAHSVVHHVERLERALDQIASSLRTGGVLALNEYVGPSRLQFSDRALGIVNDVMVRLPARYRRSAVLGEVYPHRERPDLAHLLRVDPSESVRSNEILPLVEERFEVLERFELGGSVLQPLLYDLVQNFDDDDPYDAALLRTLCALEGLLVDGGALASDYVVLVARPRGTKRLLTRRRGRANGFPSPVPPAAKAVPARERIELPGWRASAAVTEHADRLPTGNPACDWVTWVAAWLRERGLPSGAEVLLLEDGWLRQALAHHFGGDRVQIASRDELASAAAGGAWADRFGAVFTSGALWSAGTGASELLELARSVLHPGCHLVACEYQGIDASALAVAGALRGALHSAEGPVEPSLPPERRRRDVLGEIAAVFDRERGGLVEVLPCSGTVLEPLLDDVPAALVELGAGEAWAGDDGLLPLLCYAEERLVRDGVIAPSYVVAIARRGPDRLR